MKRILVICCLIISSLLLGAVTVTAENDELLQKYENSDREFIRSDVGDKIVYFHQRVIDGAIVEKDFIVYQFNKDTKELLDKKVYWRTDLPERIPSVIPREQAESMAGGKVEFSELYFISPKSDVFPLDPAPKNPCWVVRSVRGGNMVVTIIDAISAEFLGYGIPPPQATGYSLSGPQYWDPCNGTWDTWYKNAESWFETMGYPTLTAEWPTEEEVKSHIQSPYTAMFFELGHGGSGDFCSGCSSGSWCESTDASEISAWIANYTRMPFTFLGSCGGMCDTGQGTLSYEFRKGYTVNTATVGYCHMDHSYCSNCWNNSVSWQDTLFTYMNGGYTVKQAHDAALSAYPMCLPTQGACMRFAGDVYFAVVPPVPRVRGEPRPIVKANGKDGIVFVTPVDIVTITIGLDAGDGAGDPSELWFAVITPWFPILLPPIQLPLFSFPDIPVLSGPLIEGAYAFLFIVDDTPDGILGLTWWSYVIVYSQA
jgi:hypothetical protein